MTNEVQALPAEGRYQLGPNERFVEAEVPQNLAPEQLEKGADRMAEIRGLIKTAKQEAKDAAATFRQSIKTLEAEMDELVEQRRTKKRKIKAQCVELTNFPNGKEIWFPHPGHPRAIKIAEMALSAEELSKPPLFGDGGKAGNDTSGKVKGGKVGKRTKKPGGAEAH